MPQAVTTAPKGDLVASPVALKEMFKDAQLMRLNVGVFVLHMALTAMFVILPVKLMATGFAVADHWRLYLPALFFSFALMVPVMIIAIKKGKEKLAFCSAIVLMMLVLLTLWQKSNDFYVITASVILYFCSV